MHISLNSKQEKGYRGVQQTDIDKITYNMKKRLLLLTAVLSASASFTFAQENPDVKTVQDMNGNTFTYNIKSDLDPSSEGGDTIYAKTPSFTPNSDFYMITLNSDEALKVSNCNIIYNVKLAGVSSDPGSITSFRERLKSNSTVYDVVVNEFDFVTELEDENGAWLGYYVDKNATYLNKYVPACERAWKINKNGIFKGSTLRTDGYKGKPVDEDRDGAAIVSDLYYLPVGKGANLKFIPVLNVNGDYSTGITYSNAYVTYNPVAIADGYDSFTVSGDGKVGYVSGVVDDGKVEAILSNTAYQYVNFDFTNASILGTVATDINDNRLAYFANNADVSGQNIVVGNTCSNYVISDNNQEIYVYKQFSAGDAQYKRAFTPDTYGTIVLPFTVNGTSNIFVKQAKLTSYVASENKLTFTSTESIVPNTPYMFKVLPTVTGESTLYGDANVTVRATAEAKSPKFEGAQFAGTFEGLRAEIASQVYVVGAVGKIGRTTKALKPGRCYLTREDPDNFAKIADATIEIMDEDGSVEIVEADEAVTAIDGVVNGEVVSVQYISVNGQVSNQPFSGINLVKKTFEDGSVETSKVVF